MPEIPYEQLVARKNEDRLVFVRFRYDKSRNIFVIRKFALSGHPWHCPILATTIIITHIAHPPLHLLQTNHRFDVLNRPPHLSEPTTLVSKKHLAHRSSLEQSHCSRGITPSRYGHRRDCRQAAVATGLSQTLSSRMQYTSWETDNKCNFGCYHYTGNLNLN